MTAYQGGDYRAAAASFAAALKEAESFAEADPRLATTLNNLAALHHAQGGYAEAEPLLRRSLGIREKVLGAEHPDVGQSLNNLAGLYNSQGRYSEAEPLYRQTLSLYENALGEEHSNVGISLSNLALLYHAQGRYAEAESLYRRSLGIREKALGVEHPEVGGSLNNFALLYDSQGRYAEAALLYRRTLSIYEKALGLEHPNVGTALGSMAYSLKRQGRTREGLPLARRTTQMLAARFAPADDSGRAAALAEQRTRAWNFDLHVALLHEAELTAHAEGFSVAQLARASDTAEQVARMAARTAAGSDALAGAARERQDLFARLQSLDRRIVEAASRPANQRNAEGEARVKSDAEAAKKSLVALHARLAVEFPQYAELASPKPLPLADAQKLLGADEAMVLFLVTAEEGFAWFLRKDESLWLKLPIARQELADKVAKLRAQLDLGADDPARILSRPFDYALAHELYTKLLAPGERLLAGVRHLIVVPDGALTSLPPAVLVSDKPGAGEPAWLSQRFAITVLPAAGSLRALRAFARQKPANEPFIGFGDPLLDGSGDARRMKIAALYSRGAVADTREVKKLARLPDTADELKAIAATLKAPADQVRFGAQATETAVKRADLSRQRTVAFATHGLMAGDFKGLAEPALVLTPPAQGSELDDGLLTAGEISQLKLNADWVILSACNTAAPDGTPGADGLSGLAKAFFYAGARSLLVSHWAVSSEATVALTTRMFAEAGQGASKAEALRRSMLALMRTPGKPHFAHPAFWAPFVVVGEGNDAWASGSTAQAIPAPATQEKTGGGPNPIGEVLDGARRLLEGLFGGGK